MNKLIFNFVFFVLFSSLSFAQDNMPLNAYYKILGKSTNELIANWGTPLFINTNENGIQVYYYNKRGHETEFQVKYNIVISSKFHSKSGKSGVLIIFNIIHQIILEDGFSKIIYSSYRTEDSNGYIRITLQLVQEGFDSDNYYILSKAFLEHEPSPK